MLYSTMGIMMVHARHAGSAQVTLCVVHGGPHREGYSMGGPGGLHRECYSVGGSWWAS